MKQALVRHIRALAICISGLLMLIAVSGCVTSGPTAGANGTPGGAGTTTQNQPSGTNQPGSISYIGTAQNVSSSGITVSLPNGDSLTMGINAQTTGDFGTGKSLPQNGQQVKVKAVTVNDGNFAAASLDMVKPEDANDPTKVNAVDFVGFTTSTVGTDNVVRFRIGSKDYSYTATPPTTQIKDFANLQAIPANTSIKVSVQFSGSNGTVLKVGNGGTD